MNDQNDQDDRGSDFERAAEEKQMGFFTEFWCFIKDNKLWWITPIVLVLLLFGVLVILGGTGVAPFVYTLF